ncbi:hypothetical protein HMI54_014088 [Coelomomyces lativittatus]|nr:hypothetical protein HMI54_014088 [Coelomomyces lativittatus]KAJ1496899.1 hypothetical protein HMI56_005925 [Coelomomyces lativittatus]
MSKIENPSTILELSLKCTDLTKRDALSESDPIIVIYAVPKDAKIRDADEIGRTEAIKYFFLSLFA